MIPPKRGRGQPKKAPTKTISFRVLIEMCEPIKELVKNYIVENKKMV